MSAAVLLVAVAASAEESGHRAIAYFDWDRYPEMAEQRFGWPSNEIYQRYWVHHQDLQAAGIALEDVCRNRNWYDAVFGEARRVGFDTIAWETMGDGLDATPVRPSADAVAALKDLKLKVAPLLDWEIHHADAALLAEAAYISPNEASARELTRLAGLFDAFFPRSLRLEVDGRPVVFVFAYGFPEEPGGDWDGFWDPLRLELTATLGAEPLLYWTRSLAPGFVHARLHESDWVRPFSFLGGGIQGPHCLSTGLWFDGRGASERDGITRCIRTPGAGLADLRSLISRMEPAMIFHYGLNEVLEGADILPFGGSEIPGSLQRLLGAPDRDRLPHLTVVIDDLCHAPASPWLDAERRFVLDVLPGLFPDHELVLGADVGPDLPAPRLVLTRKPVSLPETGTVLAAGATFDPGSLIAAMEREWGLTARPTPLFGRPAAERESAVFVEPDGRRRELTHEALTFVPPAE